MKLKEIKKIVREESLLRKDEYYGADVFYYMAGRFPDLKISQCREIVFQIQEEIEKETGEKNADLSSSGTDR